MHWQFFFLLLFLSVVAYSLFPCIATSASCWICWPERRFLSKPAFGGTKRVAQRTSSSFFPSRFLPSRSVEASEKQRERESLCVWVSVSVCEQVHAGLLPLRPHTPTVEQIALLLLLSLSLCCECAYLSHPCHCVYSAHIYLSLSQTQSILALSSFNIIQTFPLKIVTSETCHIPLYVCQPLCHTSRWTVLGGQPYILHIYSYILIL